MLGSMMRRAMLGDGSTLTLDFTTGVLDPRLTFTRGSNATFINSQGLVQWAASNIMTFSEDQGNNVTWSAFGTSVTRTTGQSDPFGGTAAVRLAYDATSADAVISRSVSVQQGIPYVLSIWIRADSGTLSNVRIGRAASATGAVFPSLTTTWQRVSLPFTATGTSDGIEIRVLTSGSPKTATFHVFGAQLEPGSTMNAYQPSLSSVAYQAPRFDHDPTTLAPRGLLIEGQGVNNCTYSQDFGNAVWLADNSGATNPSVSTVSQTAPDGSATVNRITFNKTGGTFSRIRNLVSGTASNPHTLSVWMKANTANGGAATQNVGLRIGADPAGFNCAVTTTWKRFQYTYTLSGTDANVQIMLWDNIVGNDETADVLIWGAQLEAGSGASSYIPTGASQGTRNVDKMSLLDITPMQWNQTAGTFALSMDVAAETNTTSFPAAWGMYTATPVRVIRVLINNSGGTTPRLFVDTWTSAPTQILNQPISRPASPALTKFAFALSNSGQAVAMCVNSGAITTGSGTGTMQTPTRLLFHQDPSAADTELFPIHIRSFKYWPTSLSNAQLQSLTT